MVAAQYVSVGAAHCDAKRTHYLAASAWQVHPVPAAIHTLLHVIRVAVQWMTMQHRLKADRAFWRPGM